jgi:hypothetical protein
VTRIVSPAGAKAAGKQLAEGVVFDRNGVVETDNEAVIAYARRKGYGIDDEPPTYQRPEQPEPADPRLLEHVHRGPIRDGAVDPRPGDRFDKGVVHFIETTQRRRQDAEGDGS